MSDEMRKNLAGLLDEMESTTAEHRELNTSNYGHDDVCQLNNWGIGACELMERVILASRAQPAPMAVPDGWKLVPVEMTPEMVDVALKWGTKRSEWAELLAAAPASPPAAEQPTAQEPVGYCDPGHILRLRGGEILGFPLHSKQSERFSFPVYAATPAAEQPECGCCGQTGECDPDCDCAEQTDTVPVPSETLKKIRSDLDACQRVIHYSGGFDPAYVTDAQERLKEIDALLLGKESV